MPDDDRNAGNPPSASPTSTVLKSNSKDGQIERIDLSSGRNDVSIKVLLNFIVVQDLFKKIFTKNFPEFSSESTKRAFRKLGLYLEPRFLRVSKISLFVAASV